MTGNKMIRKYCLMEVVTISIDKPQIIHKTGSNVTLYIALFNSIQMLMTLTSYMSRPSGGTDGPGESLFFEALFYDLMSLLLVVAGVLLSVAFIKKYKPGLKYALICFGVSALCFSYAYTFMMVNTYDSEDMVISTMIYLSYLIAVPAGCFELVRFILHTRKQSIGKVCVTQFANLILLMLFYISISFSPALWLLQLFAPIVIIFLRYTVDRYKY